MSFAVRPLTVYACLAFSASIFAGCLGQADEATDTQKVEGELASPDDDEDLKWLKDNGFEGSAFSRDCVSRGEDGSVSSAEPLPVGNGRVIECSTDKSASRSTMSVLASDGSPWCALGQIKSHKGGGDDRLSVEVTGTPDNAPWTLRATSLVGPIEIHKVEFFTAMIWPIWVQVGYQVVELKPAVDGMDCDQMFGL